MFFLLENVLNKCESCVLRVSNNTNQQTFIYFGKNTQYFNKTSDQFQK